MSRFPTNFQFSQSSLQDYTDCARRFELRYLMQLKYPAAAAEPIIEYEQHIQMGEDFHRIVHQHLVGVPAEKISASLHDATLQKWWRNFLAHGFELLSLASYPELTLSMPLGGYRLTAKYDVVALEPDKRFMIVDWKTTRQRTRRTYLEQRLQTIVYRYVLVSAGQHLNHQQPILPEQVEMIYWFAEYPQNPERFTYSQTQYEQDHTVLTNLIREIEGRTQFELTQDVMRCRFCAYRSLCRRGVQAGNWYEMVETSDATNVAADFRFDFDQVAEVEF